VQKDSARGVGEKEAREKQGEGRKAGDGENNSIMNFFYRLRAIFLEGRL
jgi:hypothetical protein